jgi:cold shock CspA family protein
MKVLEVFGNPLFTGILGFILGMGVIVVPAWTVVNEAKGDARQWQSIMAKERATIAAINSLSTDTLKSWVSKVDEQNQKFMEFQRLNSKLQDDLKNAPYRYAGLFCVILISLCLGALIFISRDTNSKAAAAVDLAADMAPEHMLRTMLKTSLSNREPIRIQLDKNAADGPRQATPLLMESHKDSSSKVVGVIIWFNSEKGYGAIRQDGVGIEYFFHINDFKLGQREDIWVGLGVLFQPSSNERGPKAIRISSRV